jgi:hypothetical protein
VTRTLAGFALLAMAAAGCGRSEILSSPGEGGDAATGNRDATNDVQADGGAFAEASAVDAPGFDSPAIMSDAGASASACNPSNCPGCCSADGTCVLGEMPNACGVDGQTCEACPAGDFCGPFMACVHWVTDCNPLNCAGCCMQHGLLCSTGLSNMACGQNGGLCVGCEDSLGPMGETGQCMKQSNGGGGCIGLHSCGAENCGGCCVGDVCMGGTTSELCGANGATCRACGDLQCVAGGCVDTTSCGPTTCPGCCVGADCAYGNQDTACGVGGAPCEDCAEAGQKCVTSADPAPSAGCR